MADAGTPSVVIGTAVVQPDTTWSIKSSESFGPTDGTKDGERLLTLSQLDLAGNPSDAPVVGTIEFDTTPSAAPAFDQDSLALTDDQRPVITGTGVAGDTVVLLGDTDGDGVPDTVLNTSEVVEVNGVSEWSITPGVDLPGGLVSLVAYQVDVAGNISATTSDTIEIDLEPPAAPEINVLPIQTTKTPTITGLGTPGFEVTLEGDADFLPATPFTGLGTAIVQANGTWSITTTDLVDGTIALSATQKNSFDAIGAAGTGTVEVRINAPGAPTFDAASLVATSDLTPTITGTGSVGDLIRLRADIDRDGTVDTTIGSVVVGADGTWSVTASEALPVDTAPGGATIAIAATQFDANGIESAAEQNAITIDPHQPDAPEITSGGLTNNKFFPIQGTGEAGAIVSLEANGVFVDTGTVLPNGTWSITPPPGLPFAEGAISLAATQLDAAGNTSDVGSGDIRTDYTPPNEPNSVFFPFTNDATPLISGTAVNASGGQVKIYLDDNDDGTFDQLTKTEDVTVDDRFYISPDLGKNSGEHTFAVTLTDEAGNESTQEIITLTVSDGSRPSQPQFDLRTGLTNDSTPTITGSGTNGHIVELLNSDDEVLGTFTIANNTWSIDIDPAFALSPGLNQLRAYATDPATGLTSFLFDVATRELDTSAPGAIVTDESTTETGTTSSVTLSSDGTRAYVFDNLEGLQIIDLASREVTSLESSSNPSTSYGVTLSSNDTKAYVGDDLQGFQVIDVSDPTAPSVTGAVAMTGTAVSVALSSDGRYAYVADDTVGLQIIDLDGGMVGSIGVIGTVDTDGTPVSVTLSADDSTVYVADSEGGLQIIDVTVPADASLTSTVAAAGIAGSVTRAGNVLYIADPTIGLQIIDLTDPAAPVTNTIATPGTAVSVTLSTDGNTAYVADSAGGLQVIDITDPAAPVTTTVATTGTAVSVVLSDDENTAYVADSDGGLQIIDITDPALPSTTNVPTAGTAVSVTLSTDGNTAYVADSAGGLQVIDITDPAAPVTTTVATTGTAVSVVLSDDENTAYVADSDGGLQIIDITDPALPSTTNVPTAGTAVSVVLSTDGNTAYVADSAGGLQIIDITDPALPSTTNVPTAGTAVSVVLSDDENTAYVADSAGGLQVIDVSDPAAAAVTDTVPIQLGNVDGVTLSSDGNTAYVADSEGGLRIVDVTDPTAPVVTNTVLTTGTAVSVALSADGNTAYVADSDEGLQIIDITDPAAPVTTNVPTTGTFVSVAVDGNTVYVADSDGGLVVIDVTDPANPTETGTLTTTGTAVSVAVDGSTVYVADSNGGLVVIDVTDPANPIETGTIDTDDAVGVAVDGTTAYVADGAGGLQWIDLSTESVIGDTEFSGSANASTLSPDGNTAYVAGGAAGLRIIDVTDPTEPSIINTVPPYSNDFSTSGLPPSVESVTLSPDGNTAFVADRDSGLVIIDVTDPTAPSIINAVPPAISRSWDVTLSADGNTAYVAGESAGLQIIDVSDPATATETATVVTDNATGVAVHESTAYVADEAGGLKIIDVSDPLTALVTGSVTYNSDARRVTLSADGQAAFVADRESV